MTREDYLIKALGSYQLSLINQNVEIAALKEKLFKLEKLAAESTDKKEDVKL